MTMHNSSLKKVTIHNEIGVDKCMDKLQYFESQIELIPSDQSERFISVMESLWAFLSSIENDYIVTKLQNDIRFATIQKYLAGKWHEYINLIEVSIANKFLTDKSLHNSTHSALSEEDYVGVNKELSLLARTLSDCTVIMLGCGPFPETLMEIYKLNNGVKRVIGIEKRSEIGDIAKRVIKRALPNIENVKIESAIAETLNYEKIDIVFLANGLLNKGAILQRIYDTSKSSVEVIARNPILMGKILYEDLYTLPQLDLFTVCSSVQASKLSETLLLKKRSV